MPSSDDEEYFGRDNWKSYSLAEDKVKPIEMNKVTLTRLDGIVVYIKIDSNKHLSSLLKEIADSVSA